MTLEKKWYGARCLFELLAGVAEHTPVATALRAVWLRSMAMG